MRGGRVFLRVSLIAILAVSVALPLPTIVDARPRLFGVLRAFMGGVAGLGVGHQYYRHHRHAIAARHDAPRPEAAQPEAAQHDATRPDNERPPAAGAEPPAEKSAGLQLPPPPASLSNLPEADF